VPGISSFENPESTNGYSFAGLGHSSSVLGQMVRKGTTSMDIPSEARYVAMTVNHKDESSTF
jgi:hypothetical protein